MSSDEASSRVTYTSISSDYEKPSNVGPPGFFVYGSDGLPRHPVDPPSPNYVSGPEEPQQAPLSSDYIPGPEYPEYLAPSDEEVPVKDRTYAAANSPISLSSGYIIDLDPEEDPKDEPEDGFTDYPTDGVDDDDSSGDDADDEEEEEASKEDKEEEHLAPADSTATASLVVDPVPSAKETEPFETDESASTPPPPAYRTTARIIPLPLPLSSPLPLPPPIILPRNKTYMVLMRAAVPSTYIIAPRSRTPPSRTPQILPLPLPTSSLPLPLPSTDRRADVPEAVLPPRLLEALEQIMILLALWIPRLDVTQIERDRRYHANTALLVEREARVSREAWAHSMDASHKARYEKMPPRRAPKTRTTPVTATATTPMTDAAIKALISLGVADTLAEHEIQRNNNLNGDGSQGSGSGIARPSFATCTLHGVALTWWKSHVKTVGHDTAYGVPWNTLMKMMTAKYCPQNEIKKLEMEIWELKVKGT
nr:reverse transcriptase domain-containing protein [Tanacetum cinerariifolium]GEX67968.1 reverse transcriptase domain-containing protein [Tanacetum cinerariifolium]